MCLVVVMFGLGGYMLIGCVVFCLVFGCGLLFGIWFWFGFGYSGFGDEFYSYNRWWAVGAVGVVFGLRF